MSASNSICIRIWGGLGNQMFQYAAGYALAKRHGVKLLVDPVSTDLAHTAFGLDLFDLKPDFWEPDAGSSLLQRLGGKPKAKKRRKLWKGPVYQQEVFCSDDGFEAAGPGSYLIGYFQSERFFSDCAEDIRTAFSLNDVAPTIDQNLKDMAAAPTSVSVHIRRGDYINNPQTTAVHGILGDEYYTRAFEVMSALVPGSQWLVFSDDIDAADALTKTWQNRTLIEGHNREQDLWLMSACSNHVIANSSFSWWGAWLGRNPEKKVIGPRRWFSRAEMHKVYVDDVCPEGWILV